MYHSQVDIIVFFLQIIEIFFFLFREDDLYILLSVNQSWVTLGNN